MDNGVCEVLPPTTSPSCPPECRFPFFTPENDILVDTSLRSLVDPCVFAAGDCCEILSHKRPKAGVFAVMASMTLAENLKKACLAYPSTTENFSHYYPQSNLLAIINCCNGTAIASRGQDVAVRGAWVWKLKNWIDVKWMHQYSGAIPQMVPADYNKDKQAAYRFDHYSVRHDAVDVDPTMRCGACANKLASHVLHEGLEGLGKSGVDVAPLKQTAGEGRAQTAVVSTTEGESSSPSPASSPDSARPEDTTKSLAKYTQDPTNLLTLQGFLMVVFQNCCIIAPMILMSEVPSKTLCMQYGYLRADPPR